MIGLKQMMMEISIMSLTQLLIQNKNQSNIKMVYKEMNIKIIIKKKKKLKIIKKKKKLKMV